MPLSLKQKPFAEIKTTPHSSPILHVFATVLTLCTLCIMRVLLLVWVGPTLFLASNSFKAESVTTSPPFVNCSENTIMLSVNISTYAYVFNALMLDQKSIIMGGEGRDRITVTKINQSRFHLMEDILIKI